jgi:hypothetical protein
MSTLVPATDAVPAGTPGAAAPIAPAERTNTRSKDAADHRWQVRLLPLMSRMIVGLTIFFFAASLGQLLYLDRTIQRVPATDLTRLGLTPATGSQPLPSAEFRILASLDAALLERRYHQANVFLMGRLWTSYLGFVTGMILALVGAVFILGKMREEASELGAAGPHGPMNLRSSSPGVILAALGVVLMITTIVTNHPIQTADSPVFVGSIGTKPDAGGLPDRGNPASDSATPRPSVPRP